MTYTVYDVKKHLKQLAVEIRALKQLRKLEHNQNLNVLNSIEPEILEKAMQRAKKDYGAINAVHNACYEFRNWHIAYCEFRGKSREQIEKPADGNSPNEQLIAQIKENMAVAMEKVRAAREETLRASA